MNKNYLPSKIFVIRIAVILIIIGLFFGVYKTISYFRNRSANKTPIKVLVKNVIEKDSNNNGIADWEEYLWGLNPEKDGESNKEYIFAKRKTLAENNNPQTEIAQKDITTNDQLSREFFSIIMSLEQSGTLNQESINLVSEAVGQKIDIAPIPDIYTKDVLKIKDDSITSATGYHNSFKSLVKKYEDKNIGDELVFISEGLKNNDQTAMNATKSVALSYKEFGQELINIPVPSFLASTHLDLANNYEKTGQSVDGLTQILDDPIAGMKAVLNYKKYSDALVSDIEYLSDNL